MTSLPPRKRKSHSTETERYCTKMIFFFNQIRLSCLRQALHHPISRIPCKTRYGYIYGGCICFKKQVALVSACYESLCCTDPTLLPTRKEVRSAAGSVQPTVAAHPRLIAALCAAMRNTNLKDFHCTRFFHGAVKANCQTLNGIALKGETLTGQ